MGILLRIYRICGPMGLALCQGVIEICGIYVMGMLKKVRRYLLLGWLIFADVECLCYPESSPLDDFSFQNGTFSYLWEKCLEITSMRTSSRRSHLASWLKILVRKKFQFASIIEMRWQSKISRNSQKILSNFLSWTSTAEDDYGGIGGTPLGWGATATLSASIRSTSSLRWMNTVFWSRPNT